MAEIPPRAPERQYTDCPFCTIQIPAEAKVCPHCRKAVPAAEKGEQSPEVPGKRGSAFLERLRAAKGMETLADLWVRHGKWAKVAGPVAAAILLLFLVYGVWVGYKVNVAPNPVLPVKVEREKREQSVLLKVFVTNKGEDVPDLSLKSIGIVMEFVYRDGRREKKTVFPKAGYRGEGALLHGETGSVEVEAPTKDLQEVVLRSEIVDLGTGRVLVPPGGRRRVVPDQR